MIQKFESVLKGKDALTSDTNLYKLSLLPNRIHIKPGQYVTLSIVSADGATKYNRAYSVAGFGDDAKIEGDGVKTGEIYLLIRTLPNGKATQTLSHLPLDTKVSLFGPTGNLFPPSDTKTPLLLCGSATGIAPFLSFLEYYTLIKSFPQAHVFFGVRHLSDLHLLDLLEKYESIWTQNSSKLHIKVCVSQEESSALSTHKYSRLLYSGRMTQHISSSVQEFAGCTYLCGGKEFVTGMQEYVAKNLPRSKVCVEKFF